jgi:uncharacterized sulfatase
MRKNVLLISAPAIILNCFAEKSVKPNIIYIMSDDHATQAIGVYGSRLAELNPTPNIDRLAKSGTLFTNVYCSNSISVPSRATILTGQYSQANGALDLEGVLKPENQYLPIEMKKLGYQTAVVGKWHLTEEPASFDYYCVLNGQGEYFDPQFKTRGKSKWPDNTINKIGHSTDIITDLGLDWLKNRDKSKPFFLMHQYKAPHDFFEFAPRYKDYLEDVFIPEPASLYYNYKHGSIATRGANDSLLGVIASSVSHRNKIRNMGMHMEIDSAIPDPEYTSLAYQEYLKRYLRCVKGIDDNLQRLLDYLKHEGLLENTIIIYTSDQGFLLGEHDYIDKRFMYEESMRMPFIVSYPKSIKPNTSSDLLINNADFAPTLIEMAGGKVPEYMQGKSFSSVLKGKNPPAGWRTGTYYRYWMHMAHKHANPAHFGIRTKDYKLIFYYGTDFIKTGNEENEGNRYGPDTPVAWEFYDLKNDKYEMVNRYHDPAYAGIIQDMKKQLIALRKEINETDERFPHIQAKIDMYWNR